jgi:hypothetical protein
MPFVADQGCQMAYFQTKNTNLCKFLGQWTVLVNFMATWSILLQFGIYFVAIWYILWLFGICFFPFWYIAPIKIWQHCCRPFSSVAVLCVGVTPA